jgi:hypothetical protein
MANNTAPETIKIDPRVPLANRIEEFLLDQKLKRLRAQKSFPCDAQQKRLTPMPDSV